MSLKAYLDLWNQTHDHWSTKISPIMSFDQSKFGIVETVFHLDYGYSPAEKERDPVFQLKG